MKINLHSRSMKINSIVLKSCEKLKIVNGQLLFRVMILFLQVSFPVFNNHVLDKSDFKNFDPETIKFYNDFYI